MEVDYKLIGRRIKNERLNLGLTQETMAERLDVTNGYVSQVERGITKISLELLAKIAVVLDKDISFFVSGSAIESENYMLDGITPAFKQLSKRDKKLVSDIIRIMLKEK